MSGRSPETKLDWPELIDQALTVPGKVGDQFSRFYDYSFLNCLLLLMQGVEPQPVATYKRWQKVGRQVVKGARAKEIVRPISIPKKNEAGEVEGSFLRFKAVRCIFTLADTEGPDLPPIDLPEWSLDRALTALDIRQVPFRQLNGNVAGYSQGREVAINPVTTDHLSTMMHEVGHVVLGHTEPAALAEYQAHRGTKEFQAEATAFLSLKELDQLDDGRATESRGYIQGWVRGSRPSDVAIRQVFSATDKIIKAGRPARAETEEVAA